MRVCLNPQMLNTAQIQNNRQIKQNHQQPAFGIRLTLTPECIKYTEKEIKKFRTFGSDQKTTEQWNKFADSLERTFNKLKETIEKHNSIENLHNGPLFDGSADIARFRVEYADHNLPHDPPWMTGVVLEAIDKKGKSNDYVYFENDFSERHSMKYVLGQIHGMLIADRAKL